jgi:hypothetical protein
MSDAHHALGTGHHFRRISSKMRRFWTDGAFAPILPGQCLLR